MSVSRNRVLLFLSRYLGILGVVGVTSAFTWINPHFLGPLNVRNILTDTAPLLLMSAGVTLVLLLGSIDLSTGSLCTLTCVITGLYIGDYGNVVIPAMVLVGLAAGMVNGLLFTRLKVPSFIVTLCTSAVWQCFALLISGGAPKGIPIPAWPRIAWTKTLVLGMPILFVLSLLVLLGLYFVERRTVLGREIFAVGANEPAARKMGLNLERAKLFAFMASGVGSALAGVLYAIKLKSSLPTIGLTLNLLAIASVVLGGTALTGGRGGVHRTLIGVVLVILIQNGLNVVGVDAFWQQIVFGALIIVAINLNADKSGSDVIVK